MGHPCLVVPLLGQLFYPPPFKGGVGGGWRRAMVMNRRNANPPSIPPCKGGRFFPTLRKERRMGHPCLNYSVAWSLHCLIAPLFGR